MASITKAVGRSQKGDAMYDDEHISEMPEIRRIDDDRQPRLAEHDFTAHREERRRREIEAAIAVLAVLAMEDDEDEGEDEAVVTH